MREKCSHHSSGWRATARSLSDALVAQRTELGFCDTLRVGSSPTERILARFEPSYKYTM